MKLITIDQFGEFQGLLDDYKREAEACYKDSLILIFLANDDPATGQSWCPDCVKAKPIIDRVIGKFSHDERIRLAHVQVGHREEWKRNDNPYREHDLKLSSVPTIINLKNNRRLSDDECWDEDKVSSLFSGL